MLGLIMRHVQTGAQQPSLLSASAGAAVEAALSVRRLTHLYLTCLHLLIGWPGLSLLILSCFDFCLAFADSCVSLLCPTITDCL